MAAQSRGGRPAAKRTPAKKAQPATTNKVEIETPTEETPTATTETIQTVEVKAETEETPEQREIRELKEQIAQLRELALAKAEPENTTAKEEDPAEGEKITIHFVEDGWTAQGQVWYRGQELEFVVGEKAWQDTLDANGDSWVLISEQDQDDRFGKVSFRRGPWPGKNTYTAGQWTDPKTAPPESALAEADNKERERRRRGAPTLPKDLDKI